ncbi:alpha/beta hydrolase [Pseudonocardia ailaonensis]|uniref:Alpha/beta hydrolase n=1 Tax=Pseudonocardia ailaonensis TaxID=367279 RepID=A0ABN2NKI3_9PSEU
MTELFTPSGVRLRLHSRSPGELNWLLLPGGPGIGAVSLAGLADAIDVPGAVWLVDLPGDADNVTPPGVAPDPFATWPGVLVEAAQLLPDCVYVGHSTGGMYLLSAPELEGLVRGLALVSTSPDATWRPAFVAMTERDPLPAVDEATRRYEADPTNENLGAIAVASAEWNFTAGTVDRGREFLARMPYNKDAVAWSDVHFDDVYAATWWPTTLPVLVLGGGADRIVVQTVWDRPGYDTPNVLRRTVDGGAHFLWFERPEEVRRAFAELTERVLGG